MYKGMATLRQSARLLFVKNTLTAPASRRIHKVQRGSAFKNPLVLGGTVVGGTLCAYLAFSYRNNSSVSITKETSTSKVTEVDLESKSLSKGEARVKFQTNRIGNLNDFFKLYPSTIHQYEELCSAMKKHARELEECGITPVMHDGKVGGNLGALINTSDGDVLLVTKSGKAANLDMDKERDFTIIKSFDKKKWSCEYYSNDDNVLPTSDTPLHFTALTAHSLLGWKERPTYLVHGHAFATEEDSKKFGFPISTEETLFSTPEDSNALFDLLEKYQFPENKVFIRKGHGFVLIGKSADDAWQTFQQRMKPYL